MSLGINVQETISTPVLASSTQTLQKEPNIPATELKIVHSAASRFISESTKGVHWAKMSDPKSADLFATSNNCIYLVFSPA